MNPLTVDEMQELQAFTALQPYPTLEDWYIAWCRNEVSSTAERQHIANLFRRYLVEGATEPQSGNPDANPV